MKLKPPVYDAETVEQVEAYLDQHYMTEIVESLTISASEVPDESLQIIVARGFDSEGTFNGRPGVRKPNNYSRPMFQILSTDHPTPHHPPGPPCPECGDFSRSWNCPDHPEVEWDWERRFWKRPCTGESTCECFDCRRSRVTVYSNIQQDPTGFNMPERLYATMVSTVWGERLENLPDQTIRIQGIFDEGNVTYDAEQP